MARILSLYLAATLMMVSASAFAAGPLVGDPKAGHQKNAMCAGCHGIPGWRTAYPDVYSVPKLGGQHPQYIIAALKAYKAGQRSHPTMQVIASALSDQDMADLAAYYGGGSESSTKK